jgi:dTDP-4-dehydrorhamnose 3,5-epimerase
MKGVTITPLTKIPDDRGTIMHMVTSDMIERFGEVYFSTVYPGIVKAWHLHKEMTLNYCVIKGMIKLVVGDGSDFEEIYLGDKNYCLVTIKPNIYNGFMGIGTEEAIVANLTDIPHDKEEILRLPFDYFDYDWKVKNR